MAISLIGTATTAFGTGGASSALGTIAYPSTIADGDFCFVYMTKNDESGLGYNVDGFITTFISTTFSQDMAAGISYRRCDGTETGNITLTADANGDDWSAIAFILRGVDPINPFDVLFGAHGRVGEGEGGWQFDENHAPDAVKALTTVTDGAWVLVGNGSNDDGVTSQTLTGYTEIGNSYDSSTFASQVVFYKEKTTAGAESPGTITTNGIDSVNADLYQSTIAIRPAGSDEVGTSAPVVESVAYNVKLALTGTSVDFDYPSGIVAGDEIIAVFATGNDAFTLQSTDDDFEYININVDSPWAQSSAGGDDKQIGVWRREADGTEGSTFRVRMSSSTVDVMMMVFRISGGRLHHFWKQSSSHWEATNFTDDDSATRVFGYAPADDSLMFHNIVCVDGFYTEGNATLTSSAGIGTPTLYDDVLSGAVHGQMSILSFVGTATDMDTFSDSGTLDMDQSTQAQADLTGMFFWIVPLADPGTDYTETATEAVGVTDDSLKAEGKLATDAVGVTDATLKAEGKLVTDAVGVTDTTIEDHHIGDVTETVTEAVGVTDTVLDDAGEGEVATDAVGVTDNTLKAEGKLVTDVVGVTDTVLGVLDESDYQRTVTETVGVTDVVASVESAELGEWGFIPI